MRAMCKWVFVGVVGAIATAGCAAEDSSDGQGATGELAQAIGTECSAASTTAAFVGGANYTSPQTYSTTSCFKAVVVDISNYSSTFLGAGNVAGGTYISWADSAPTTQAACTSSWVRADLFVWQNNAWTYKGFKTATGIWTPFFGSFFCETAQVGFTAPDLVAGNTYRIAATARTAATSDAATRKVSVLSEPPVIIQ